MERTIVLCVVTVGDRFVSIIEVVCTHDVCFCTVSLHHTLDQGSATSARVSQVEHGETDSGTLGSDNNKLLICRQIIFLDLKKVIDSHNDLCFSVASQGNDPSFSTVTPPTHSNTAAFFFFFQ